MARKNVLSNLIAPASEKLTPVNPVQDEHRQHVTYKGIGALGAVTRSIDALAAKADAAKEIEAKLTAGEVVIELEPDQIEESFVSDRLAHSDQQFQELVEAMRVRGQDSPILVRPHPAKDGVYQIAFGHRRAKAARLLGRPVRAVVKALTDRDHVIAQGQENSARADLSFLERATFAGELETRGFDRETIMAALSADKTTVSKMLSVVNRIPKAVRAGIGPALAIGRDRWHELATRFDEPANEDRAVEFLARERIKVRSPEERFNLVSGHLAKGEGSAATHKPAPATWERKDVQANIKANGRQYTIALKAADAAGFGAYITRNLDRLYEAYRSENKQKSGD
ncbi:plasmid partitioning protein RepB [Shinella zoogloeoides]|uniref:Plasmid partitioning protein RepB n=1 Tax=Shinella zoogloeoides TaxID=352475 RepID=A0A6N8TDF6_SHIZO|nr:plasmid partitioning protein RepB [Shinella zoogloeoides]MXO00475.1 plasmid partitioning protein RepB [Shinella zoogloeoides]UEX83930.1 plasmid partitioning protein RepB [Shinella zoogloeoides]